MNRNKYLEAQKINNKIIFLKKNKIDSMYNYLDYFKNDFPELDQKIKNIKEECSQKIFNLINKKIEELKTNFNSI